eukprot:Pompholyxophrys_punicea_v1_NODE_393_length_2064_cov_23.574415.p1 type:complete len:238 gc:universal NODE_393_length_2064_cov_23.574415:1336-623(-)
MVFGPNDPPPFYAPMMMTPHPRKTLLTQLCQKRGPGKNSKKQAEGAEVLVDNIIQGYVGKCKGKKQVLWERGLFKDKMTVDNVDPALSMNIVLANCPDFLAEKSALQALVEDRGHILLMSPKCHPELAGLGVEYSWGKSKLEFCRNINDGIASHLRANVEKSLSQEILPLCRVRKYARKTRDYRNVYRDMESSQLTGTQNLSEDQVTESHQLIENMVKERKAHRNIVHIEKSYLLHS